LKFRHDINGLRAVAVLAVVFFHFGLPHIDGGFAGVDVFFVISGYLMTAIIVGKLRENNFDIFNFYIHRANRIIPALVVLSVCCLIFGWFFLVPSDYRTLAKHVASSVLFVSNQIYFMESGYFDASSLDKWLLHTWSLSVEWQFYVVYPILLLSVKRFIHKHYFTLGFCLTTFGLFILNIYLTNHYSNFSYFSFVTRSWEMMCGGIAFLLPEVSGERKKKITELVGLCLILLSYFYFDDSYLWPGFYAAFPVFGAFLIILASRQNSIFTSNALFTLIGKWSYSLYLWHWPIFVGINYFSDTFSIPLALVLSTIAAILSYYLIECKKFKSHYKLVGLFKTIPLYLSIAIFCIGGLIFVKGGFSTHYAQDVVIASDEEFNKNSFNCLRDASDTNIASACFVGNRSNPKAVVIGDSHADAVTSSFLPLINPEQESIVAFTKSACPFLLDAKSNKYGDSCYLYNNDRVSSINKFAGLPMFVISRWPAYLVGQSNPKRVTHGQNGPSIYFVNQNPKLDLFEQFGKNLTATLCALPQSSLRFVVLPIPEIPFDVPKELSRSLLLKGEYRDFSISTSDYERRNEKIVDQIYHAASDCGVKVLDPRTYLCRDGRCLADIDGRPLYHDGDHLSEFGNKLLTPMFSL
jgi:peptidoglycan/LPS O-acetylase OafA/YrhL